MRPSILLLLYLAVTLLPLALAGFGTRPPRSIWDELAAGAGLLAFSIILVEFVLSGRFRAISARIGMDATMRFHQLLARSALVLALVHPFLYRAAWDRPYPWDVTRELTVTTDVTALATGIVAWLLLGVLVPLSVWRDRTGYSYETWRLAHGIAAVLIAATILHHALSAGRYSQDPVLAGVCVALFVAALMSLAYVYVVDPLLQRRRPWTVRSVRPLALKTWALELQPDGHRGLAYEAGQFVWLNIGHSAFSLHENPFSIASAPASGPRLEFVIKELGDFTRSVGRIEPGTRAFVDGPHGNLTVSRRTEPGIALIAGGVGIAPLLGILRGLRLENDARPTALVYGNRIEEQIVCREELETLAREHGTRVIYVLSEPPKGWTGETGLVDAALISRLFAAPETRRWLFVLCGPPPMMETVEDALIAMGVPAGQILSESFKYD